MMLRAFSSVLALAVFAGASLSLATAQAADLGYGGYKDGNPAADDLAIDGLKVGGIVVVLPKYEGSDHYEVIPIPYVLPTFAGGGPDFFSRIDAKDLDDVRYKLIDRDGFVAGPLVGWNLGRDDRDGPLLRGLGDVDGGFVGGAFVGYHFGPVLLDVSFHNTFGGDGGYLVRFGAEVERPIRDHVTLTARVGTNYADGEYMQNYFGVSAAQSLNSVAGLPAFDADAGFKDVFGEVGLKAELNARWSAQAMVRYSRLIGDAADSPVVESENQFIGLFGLSYKFDVDR
jgi:outer membrane scaffolding protein for murein synthesis (MipA/OmpV family)